MSELNSVTDEIDNDLPESGDITNQDFGDGVIDEIGQVETLLGGFGRKQVQRLLDAGVQLERMPFQFQLARFNFGKVQDVINNGQQGIGTAAGRFDIFALFIG